MKREICCRECALKWARLINEYPGEHQKHVKGVLRVECFCDGCNRRLSARSVAVAVSLYTDDIPYRGPWEQEYLVGEEPPEAEG